MKIERKLWAALVLSVGVTVTGCKPEKDEAGQPAATDLSNPAAVFCTEKGGSYEIRNAEDGSQTGICILQDGTEVDAWAYFKEQQNN